MRYQSILLTVIRDYKSQSKYFIYVPTRVIIPRTVDQSRIIYYIFTDVMLL